ncbi:MAG: hypothetical protein ABFD98_01850 [Syntrophobacteraceae bacterium]|nr:hypothetical protein [Desulfobacteraceae bacterium]
MKRLAIALMMAGVFFMGSLAMEPPMANAGWYDSHGVYHPGHRPRHRVKKHRHVKKHQRHYHHRHHVHHGYIAR